MFDGVVDIRNFSDNQVIMTGYEDGKLLKLKGSSARVHNYAYLSQHGEGNFFIKFIVACKIWSFEL